MSNTLKIIICLILASLIFSGCKWIRRNTNETDPNATPTPVQGETVRNENHGMYDFYDEAFVEEANNKKIVLFFFAEVNKESRDLENDILSNVSDIPTDVIILKVDYEINQELKDKYNIDEENELVLINSNQEEKKLDKASSLDDILSQID